MRLKLGIFASSGAAAFFQGVVNWLTGNDAGKLFASEDGQTFAQIDTDVFGTSNVNDVFYGVDLSIPTIIPAVIVPDNVNTGTSWITVTSNFGNSSIESIAYGNGLWLAGGYGNRQIRSTNGSTWTTQTSNLPFTFSIAYGNGLWVAGGSTGGASSSGQIHTSTNGSTWTTVTSNFGVSRIRSIAYGNNLWVAGGYGGQIRTSTNGSTWTTVTSNFGTTAIRSIAYANGLWVAGGNLGQMRTSTNATTWTTVTSNFGSANIFSIAYGNGLWVAGGYYGNMRTSTNGSTWTTVTSNFGSALVRSIAYANGLWVAGGNIATGPTVARSPQMRKSTNATTWTTVTSNFPSNFTGQIRSIAYDNNLWVAGGYYGQIRTSTQLYNTISPESTQYNSNTFLAAGNDGKLAKSSDGLTWSTINTSQSTAIETIGFGNNTYYIGGI
jgi:hypothetical protein